MTRVVLNVCGIKSKGGITVLNNFLKNNSNLDLYIIYDNLDLENHVSRYKNQFIRVPRFCHPFLNFFINKNLKETINSYENIIHFGNLAFKTKIYSYTFIQNILPLVEPTSSLRNFLLRIFYSYSFRISDEIIVQQEHVAKRIPKNVKVKIIGSVNFSNISKSKNSSFVIIYENIKNKNPNFTFELINELSKLDYKINVIDPEDDFSNLYNKNLLNEKLNVFNNLNHSELLNTFKESLTYIHTSKHETVGLPIYEALANGLNVVVPNQEYFKFDTDNIYKYKLNDLNSAVEACKNSLINDSETASVPIYYEDWNLNFQ